MSTRAMKPKFTNYEGYQAWKVKWAQMYREISIRIRQAKLNTKEIQRVGTTEEAAAYQRRLSVERAMGSKAMTLLDEAKARWEQIKLIRRGIAEQHAQFPLDIKDARNIDFHFNKKHLEFPELIPMWIVKAKGTTWYCNHVDCMVPWSTREQPDNPSTKGAIRIKRGNISINSDGLASIV